MEILENKKIENPNPNNEVVNNRYDSIIERVKIELHLMDEIKEKIKNSFVIEDTKNNTQNIEVQEIQENKTIEELSELLKSQKQEITDLSKERAVVIKNVQEKIELFNEIKNKLHNRSSINELNIFLNEVGPQIKFLQESYIKIETLIESYKNNYEKHKELILQETGLSETDDIKLKIKEVTEKKIELEREIKDSKEWYKVFGIFNKEVIGNKKIKLQNLENLIQKLNTYLQDSSDLYLPNSGLDGGGYRFEKNQSIINKVKRIIDDEIHFNYKKLIKAVEYTEANQLDFFNYNGVYKFKTMVDFCNEFEVFKIKKQIKKHYGNTSLEFNLFDVELNNTLIGSEEDFIKKTGNIVFEVKSIRDWVKFKTDEYVLNYFGKEKIQEIDNYLCNYYKEIIYTGQFIDEIECYNLLNFNNPKNIPLCILAIKINDVIKVIDYISNFKKEELDEILKLNIPGVNEIINLIQQKFQNEENKLSMDTFSFEYNQCLIDLVTYAIDKKRFNCDDEYNPTANKETNNIIKELSLNKLLNPNELIMDKNNNWNELDKKLIELLKNKEIILNNILVFWLRRYKTGDTSVIKKFLFIQQDIEKNDEVNFEFKEFNNKFCLVAIKNNNSFDQEEINDFANILGLSNEEFLRAINFIKKNGSEIKPEILADVFNLIKVKDIENIIDELQSEYGYIFNYEHCNALIEVAKNKDSIIKSIKEIREFEPYFLYDIFINNQFKIEPADILVHTKQLNSFNNPQEQEIDYYFNACKKFRYKELIDNKIYREKFKELPREEQDIIIDKYIENDIGDFIKDDCDKYKIIELNENQKQKCIEKLLNKRLFSTLLFLFEKEPSFNKKQILIGIINTDPLKLLGYINIIDIKLSSEEYTPQIKDKFKMILLDSIPSLYNKVFDLFTKLIPENEKLEIDIFGEMYRRLITIQAQSDNAEYDPWKTDLDYLVESLFENEILNRNNPKDAEILYNYVREFGMFNLQNLFIWYKVISDAKEIKDIREDIKKEISDTLNLDIEKLPNKGFLIQEIKKFKNKIKDELLMDKIPNGLNTKLGIELLMAIKGKTRWEQNNKPTDVIEQWRETVTQNPKIVELPQGHKEVLIDVPLRKRKDEDKNLTEQELIIKEENKILQNPELILAIDKLKLAYRKGFKIYSDDLYNNINDWLDNKKLELLQNINEQIQIVQEKISNAKNEKVKQEIQKQLDLLENAVLQIEEIKLPDILNEDKKSDKNVVAFIEELYKLYKELPKKLKGKEDILIEITAYHSLTIMEDGFKNLILDEISNYSDNVSKESVANWSDFLQSYLIEHYFNETQEQLHTGHTPFSPNLLKELKLLFGVKTSKENIIIQQNNKLNNLAENFFETTNETIQISLVPVRGLLKIYSGDIGDACYTSQQMELAHGKYQKITPYIFVTGKGTLNERLEGSVLAIETETPSGEKVLLVRANNPGENLLQKVDSNILMSNVLNEMRELAIRRDIPIVVVPLDPVTKSSSNRKKVSEFYENNYKDNQGIALKKEDETTFNGYQNWNSKGKNPCVVVFDNLV